VKQKESSEVLSVLRGAIADTAPWFGELVRTVRDPEASAVGAWSIAETAAHVAVACAFDSASAIGIEPVRELMPLLDEALAAEGVDDVARLNALSLAAQPERDLTTLARTIEGRSAALVDATATSDPTEPMPWLAGAQLPVPAVLAHLLSELLVHGHDIAQAEGRPWLVSPRDARLFFDVFFFPLLEQMADLLVPPDARGVGDVRCGLHIRGGASVELSFEGGRMSVGAPTGRPVDVLVSAEPDTMLLVMYRRISPVLPMLRGKLMVSGRKPWRLRRFLRVLRTP
jgi:hypothetical protein